MLKLPRISVLRIAKYYLTQSSTRCNSTQMSAKSLTQLKHRTLLCLTGDDVSEFLQGLITNDMRHLKDGAMSIYSVFLNIKGRVLYDTIIYKTHEEGMLYVECDSMIANNLLKHLKMYKLRKKVDIQTLEDQMKVWTVYDDNVVSQDSQTLEKKSKLEGRIFPCGASDTKSSKLVNKISIYSDPRIVELGIRILTESTVTHNEIVKHLEPDIMIEDSSSNYKAFRYKLGIGEGVEDLPVGTSFPLEINCDYLHGVSFHKGCYIGQELTARTHHTGVVRKRLMPLVLNDSCGKELKYDDKVTNESGKVVGKIIGQEGKHVLGLIRIAEALASKTLTAKNSVLKLIKPQWWAQESQKIEASVKTSKN